MNELTQEEIDYLKKLKIDLESLRKPLKVWLEGHDHVPTGGKFGIQSQSLNISESAGASIQKVLQTTRAINAASGDVVIAHGLATKPKYVLVFAKYVHNGTERYVYSMSDGWSDGTLNYENRLSCGVQGSDTYQSFTASQDNSFCLQIYARESSSVLVVQVATLTIDATNITLTFTKSGTSTYYTDNIYITLIAIT